MNENSGGGGKRTTTTLAEEMMIDTEAAVMANFEFLASEVRFFIVFAVLFADPVTVLDKFQLDFLS